MANVVYQQRVDSREDLVRKWPNLERVVTLDDVRTGLHFYQSRREDDFTSVDDDTAQEALRLYNDAISDGRFVHLLATEPEDAARRLGREISPQAAEVIRKGVAVTDSGDTEISPGGVVVAVVIVIVVVAKAPEHDPVVIDQSGELKL